MASTPHGEFTPGTDGGRARCLFYNAVVDLPEGPEPPGWPAFDGRKRIRGLRIRVGGVKHSGWLPAGAAVPLPTPVRDLTVDVEIDHDGHGYFLCCAAREGDYCWDTWHESLADAESCALKELGIRPGQWEAA